MSDWGRSDGPAARRRSPWPFSLGLVVGVAAMAALVFFRFADVQQFLGAGGTEVARLQARVADLEARLERARSGGSEADAAQEVERLRANLRTAEEVTTQLQTQYDEAVNRDIPALKAEIDRREEALKAFDAEIARLSRVEEELKKRLDEAANSGAGQQELQSLRDQVRQRDEVLKQLDAEVTRLSALERELETLRQEGDKAAADSAAQEELRRELDEAREKAASAEARTSERDSDLARLRGELAERDATLARLDAEVARLASLERELEALRRERSQAGGDGAETRKALQEELDRARAQAATATEQTAQRQAEIDRLKDELARRDQVLKELDAEVTRLAALEAELKVARGEIAELKAATAASGERQARIAALEAELRGVQDQLARAGAEHGQALAARDGQLAQARAALAAAQAEVTRLQGEVAALAAPAEREPAAAAQPAAPATAAPGAREATPRDPLLVAKAMSEAHGLENLSNQQRDQLATGLIEGACVAQVLSDVFGRAPAVAVRDLITALDSDC
ncbi:MAG: hypothetical protein BroJett030_07660 [Alphaproteobacteria bacterium]|nr:MAG: hypothetical protein BroJett030_07660 [Alphaproteobacteria bacterium]